MQAETALLTRERGLTVTIGLFAMSTLRTGTRGVSRVNKPDRNTRPCCFVGDHDAELIEGPAMPFIAVLVANSDTLSNTSQVLKSECLARYNGFLYQGFAYLVIGVLLETLLTSAHLFQATFCRTGTHALQEVTAVVIAHTSFMDFGTAKHLTCTIGSKVDYPQINAKSIRSFGQWRRILAFGQWRRILLWRNGTYYLNITQ